MRKNQNFLAWQDVCWFIFCLFLMNETIPVVATLRLVALTAGIGIVLMATQINKNDIARLAIFFFFNISIFLSLFFGNRTDMLVFVFTRVCIIGSYVYLYLVHCGFSRNALMPFAFGVLPQLFVFLTGNSLSASPAYTVAGQFCGTVSDPNYLCSYLIFALGAQLSLIRESQSWRSRLPLVFLVLFTMFLIIISLSRAGTFAMFLACLFFFMSFRRKYVYSNFVLTIGAGIFFLILIPYLVQNVFPDSIIDKLYQRFTQEGSASILTNERYDLWMYALNQIISRGPIDYINEEVFILQGGGVTVHNVFLRLGLGYGWLTALIHLVVWGVGLTNLIMTSCRIFSKNSFSITSILSLGLILMILPYFSVIMTIPSSDQNLYWSAFSIVFMFGVLKTKV